MPFVGDSNVCLFKKRRRLHNDEPQRYGLEHRTDDGGGGFYVLEQLQNSKIITTTPRKIVPMAKRARLASDGGGNSFSNNEDDSSTHLPSVHKKRSSQQYRTTQNPHCLSNNNNTKPSLVPGRTNTATAASLAPCHICHRRPTKKSDLDSFAECQGCGGRACYICIRECQGWSADSNDNYDDNEDVNDEPEHLSRSCTMEDVDEYLMQREEEEEELQHQLSNPRGVAAAMMEIGRARARGTSTTGTYAGARSKDNNKKNKGWAASRHRAVVCSACCIERGEAGEIVCLGCLPGLEGREEDGLYSVVS